LINWAGNLVYATDRVHTPASVEEVQEIVQRCRHLRPLGTRHSFNRIADSADDLLSVERLNRVRSLDRASKTVTVDAGMTYGALGDYLHREEYALANLASLPHISIAGACATATHGSGTTNGNLATAVSAIEFVDGTGDIVTLTRSRDGDQLLGAVVSLGALGVVTAVTLDIVETFDMTQVVYCDLPMSALERDFEAIMGAGYSVSLFTDWQRERINEVWIKSRVDGAAARTTLFDARPATKNLHPIAELSAENCTEQMGVPGPWYERLPHFRMGFTPSAGKELQAEYFVPRAQAVDAILAVERLRDQIGPHLLISEIRTIAADDLWLSPCYRQPSVAIHFTWKQDWPAVSRLLPVIERELSPFNVRPHWGKLFTVDPATLRSRYERLPAFSDLCRRFDPRGKFRNAFLQTYIFGAKG